MVEPFFKHIELEDFSSKGEPTIQVIRPDHLNRDTHHHVKLASEASEYIKTVRPQDGKTIILILAVTAGEFYGSNRNGDGWPERPLVIRNTRITADEVLPKHYKTFETDANVYKHHINKDPAKRIGEILKAFYNWPMHRVELLLGLDNERAEDIVRRILSGEFPACSMGCKVRFDVCSHCGNKAPTRRQYCDHAKFQLGDRSPSGAKYSVWNPSPKFFDLSMVRRPAEPVAFMMKKVAEHTIEIQSSAELGEQIEYLSHKVAGLGKLSLLNKLIRGEPVAAKTDEGEFHALQSFKDDIAEPVAKTLPPLDNATIQSLLKYRPAEIFSTLSSMGILLTTPEFLKYFIWKIDPSVQLPEKLLDRAVATQQFVFDTLIENPSILDGIAKLGYLDLRPENVNQELVTKLEPWVEKRAQIQPYLYRRLVPEVFKPISTSSKGKWDVIETTDPRTGRTFQTTRGARQAAEDVAGKERLKNLLGGGALLSGALALFGKGGRLGRLSMPLPAAIGGGMVYKGTRGYPSVRADTGELIPLGQDSFPGTELVEKRSSLDISNAMIRLAMDYAHQPGAWKETTPSSPAETWEDLTFDEAAAQIGEVIWA